MAKRAYISVLLTQGEVRRAFQEHGKAEHTPGSYDVKHMSLSSPYWATRAAVLIYRLQSPARYSAKLVEMRSRSVINDLEVTFGLRTHLTESC